jgi:multidrug resistance efflux pump
MSEKTEKKDGKSNEKNGAETKPTEAKSSGKSGKGRFWTGTITLAIAGMAVALYLIPANQYIVVYGNVLSGDFAALRAGSKGPIERISVVSGQWVKKGDVLLELESDVERADVAKCQCEYDQAKAEHLLMKEQMAIETEVERLQARYAEIQLQDGQADHSWYSKLRKQGAASDREADKAKVALELAKVTNQQQSLDHSALRQAKLLVHEHQVASLASQLERAKNTLARRTVTSPMDGIIVLHSLSLGKVVDANEVLGQVFDARTFQVVARVPERYLRYLYRGQAAYVELSSYPEFDEGEIAGQVDSILPVIQPQGSGDGTFRIQATLTQWPDNVKLSAGMSAEIALSVGKRPMLMKLLGRLPRRFTAPEVTKANDEPRKNPRQPESRPGTTQKASGV